MALDEAVARCVLEGLSPPTLRLYGWDAPSVSIGCFQRSGELDLDFCKTEGIPVVRRPTGGRGILHGRHGMELTYSFCAPRGEGRFHGRLRDDYGRLAAAFSGALRALGLETETAGGKRPSLPQSPLCFASASYGETTVKGKKIIGSAQRRWPGGFLQQGSIPYVIDRKRLGAVFRGGGDNGDLAARMAGLRELSPQLKENDLKHSVREAFEETFGVRLVESPLLAREEALLTELLETKYLNPAWNFQR